MEGRINQRGWGLAAMLIATTVHALPTKTEAMALVFPGASFERHELFLTVAQAAKVKELAGSELHSRFAVEYVARKEGLELGIAFFDTHVVRTQPETAMVAIAPDGAVLRVEVIDFREPQEYRAPAAWTAQFRGKALAPALSLKGDIRPLSGASLTASALTDATRRCLALFHLFHAKARK